MFKKAKKYLSNLRHATATRNWGNIDYDDDGNMIFLPPIPAWKFVLNYVYMSIKSNYCKHDYTIEDTGGPEYGPCIWGTCKKCGQQIGPFYHG